MSVSPGRPKERSVPLGGTARSARGQPGNAALAVEGLGTVLDTDAGLVRAVDALSLTIERGETFALVGESGCGKSMTALSILRLLPDNGRVDAGRVNLAGMDVTALPEARMRDVRGRRISIIFQEPATSLNPVLRVGAQIVEVIERHTALKGDAARAKALQWLQRVGLPEAERRIDSYPFELSGGQKQRVMIAIALAAEPDVLIADEPTTALDVTIQKQILELLVELQKAQGMAMLLITHDLGIVSEVAHRIALMYAGQIVEVAETEEFFARPLHPYAQLLLAALPNTEKRGERLAAIPGKVPALNQLFTGCRFADRCPWAHAECVAAPPPLFEPVAEHQVRCVLYKRGKPARCPPWQQHCPVESIAPSRLHARAGYGIGYTAVDCSRLPRVLPDSPGTLEAHDRLRQGGRRHLVRTRRRPHARVGRRIRMRQDDDRQGVAATATRQRAHRRRGQA